MPSVWQKLWHPRNIRIMYLISFFTPAGPTDFFWRWQRIKNLLKHIRLKNPEVIELGSGTGVMSLKMAKEFHAHITLVDAAPNALKFAERIAYDIYGLPEDTVKSLVKDLFTLDETKKFDLVHSQGLIEHFDPADKVIEKHLALVKDNGYVMILAPRNSLAYKWVRRFIEFIYRKWPFGFEKPVPKQYIHRIMKKHKLQIIKHKDYLFSYGILAKKTA